MLQKKPIFVKWAFAKELYAIFIHLYYLSFTHFISSRYVRTIIASYISITFQDSRIKKAVTCMEAKLDDVKDSYTASVLAFALKLAGSTKANDLLKNLDKQAVRQGKNIKVMTKNIYNWF